ncbi:cell wall elongation regulator TseB-like domain-containing protein [Bacillus sp. V33-4]|uniref:cell wall elongation regulator TseB-like domain-containing protein n=1 Tax=Bacillus sp. V33-4 TaxID=2054169 RepID=UPI000C7735F3|nr:DUF5590 domain-containing protein [Bacillus sp. V33-4]PLR82678.1 peptidase [Bacillus sp. V33-4]
MKKWIIIISIAVVILIGLAANVYLNALKPVKAAEQKAAAIANAKTDLQSIKDFSIFNGDETYYVVKGTNSKNEKTIVWIPEKGGEILERKEAEGISREEAINKVREEKNPEKILSVRLGMVDNQPAWEIYSQSESGLINYYYLDFDTGEEWLTVIENL